MTPINRPDNPWRPNLKSWTQSNTVQSLVFPLVICLGVAALGHGYPEYISASITTAADGGAVAVLAGLAWRLTLQKDKLQIRNKPKP